MDPLERAQRVIARASAVCAAASQVLPARQRLMEEVNALGTSLSHVRGSLRAHLQALSACRAEYAEAEASAAFSRARLVQLMRCASELLGVVEAEFEGVESVPGLSGEGVVPVDDASLPHGVQEPLKDRARALAGSVGLVSGKGRGGGTAAALARPDVMRAAAGGEEKDKPLLTEGHAVLKRALEVWSLRELALRRRGPHMAHGAGHR
jgi:hypothetical protein